MRQPFQVAVQLYRRTVLGNFEFAVFKRSDAGYWQLIAGGGEEGETPIQAAQREAQEEAGISVKSLVKLTTMSFIPTHFFKEQSVWEERHIVIPNYCFSAMCDEPIVLSSEHSEYRWLDYNNACDLLKWDDNRTALWELNQRLQYFPETLNLEVAPE